MNTVWIVDDDRSIRWVMEKALARAGIACRSFEDAGQVLEALKQDTPAVLLSDVRMPGQDGLQLLQTVKQRIPNVPVIIMTAYSDLDSAVASFQGGAFDYLPKPFDVDEALVLIRRALDTSTLHQVNEYRGEIDSGTRTAGSHMGMLGQAPAMQELFRAIGRLSRSNATVLITGESGTGKELVARALHRSSPRANGPFVAINTAAIAKELLESELFGHEKGAFTGAYTRRIGRFEEADGGTLFLDEIGDMPADLQTRLLRVLGEGTFYRVGGVSPIHVNVRIIAATHQPLEERVRQGLFRADLFHRLNVIRLRLPPLRERPEDIELLARHFLQQTAHRLGVEPKQLTPEAMRVLRQFPFPGNVRQLENICHWLTVMSASPWIDVSDLPPEVRHATGVLPSTEADHLVHEPAHFLETGSLAQGHTAAEAAPVVQEVAAAQVEDGTTWLQGLRAEVRQRLQAGESNVLQTLTREFERTLITTALEISAGRRVEAAARLGLGRNTITRKMRELGLE